MAARDLPSQVLSDLIVWMKYGKYLETQKRRENWNEIVDRNISMHVRKFPLLDKEIVEAFEVVRQKQVLGSMRAMQFAGKAIEINNVRLYNCCYLPMEDPESFQEVMFLLLAGTGVGYSVQRHHVEKLPPIQRPTKKKRYLVPDSIEGWADCVGKLMTAYFTGGPVPNFDFRDIRPKGTLLKTSGGRAPGPEPLKAALQNIQRVLDRKENGEQLTTLEVHDINCHIADAVRSGGIRRSAMIALFNMDDDDMLTCKYGKWWEDNPQRGRANNSAVIVRHKVKKKDFLELWKKIELSGSGEPGFFFTNDRNWGLNPCGEISLRPYQFCNLVSINTGNLVDQADLNKRAKDAAFIATLQASYTDFHYLRDIWKKTTDKEALIGVSLAGIASGPVLQLNLEEAADIVKAENARVAKLIGINSAARCTTVKPDGHSSLVLATSSGIHAWHDPFYLRRVLLEKSAALYTYLSINHPEILEDDLLKPHADSYICMPQKAPEGAITRGEPALSLLDRVNKIFNAWVKPGHRKGENYNNVSTTVSIKQDEWDNVGEWMWKNRDNFTALSVLPHSDHTYTQPPFETITEEQYTKLAKKIHEINLDHVVELRDETSRQGEVACGGGACEIP